MSPRSLPRSEMPTHSYGMPIGGRKCMITSAISLHESRAAGGRVILSERFDVHAVDLPKGGPLEPPIQFPLLDRRLADVTATFASVRGVHALDRCRLRADRLALLAERLEGDPSGRVRMTG